MEKDILERVIKTNCNLKGYLTNAYLRPIFKTKDNDENERESIKLISIDY